VNVNFVVERVKKIILQPKQEWPEIEREAYSVQEIYTKYALILAAIPAIASFIGWSIIGVGVFGATVRAPLGIGIAHLILEYLLSLGAVYLLALVVDALAPSFDGQKDFMQALKLAVFSSTASWLAGIFYIVPALSIFGLLGLYSLYLLYLGLPLLMKVPEDKALPYTAVVTVASIVIIVVIKVAALLTIPGQLRGF
jgi:hypothetical protein